MTPAERARLIDKQEFEAECKAIRERAYALFNIKPKRDPRVTASIKRGFSPEKAKFNRPAKVAPKAHKDPRNPTKHTINGLRMTAKEWACHLGINYNALCARIHRTGSIEAAVAMGGARRGVITVNGKSLTATDWADHLGIPRSTLYYRIKNEGNAEAIIADLIRNPPGVLTDFEAFRETGAGGTAQETPNITFSERA